MKLILFLSLITLLSFASCQREKLNSKNTTTVNVKRDLPAPSGETAVTPDLPEKHASTEVKPNILPSTNTPIATSRPEVKKEPATPTKTVTPSTKIYHIIAASHPREELAEATLARLKAEGYTDARIIFKDNRYRVSIASYKDQQEATAQRKVLADKLGQEDLWIMVYR